MTKQKDERNLGNIRGAEIIQQTSCWQLEISASLDMESD